jgi:hypothetical protein
MAALWTGDALLLVKPSLLVYPHRLKVRHCHILKQRIHRRVIVARAA